MTYPVPDAVAAAIAGENAPCARLSALDSTGSVLEAWEATGTSIIQPSSTVSYDRTRAVRRFCSLSLANPTGSLSPKTVTDYFFTGNRFRVERGVVLGGQPYYILLGEFVVTTFRANMRGSLSISGDDPTSLCQHPFGEVVTLDGALTGEAAIRLLWEPVLGDGSGWSLDAGGRTLAGRSWSFAEDQDRLQSAIQVAADLGCELFADRAGLPVLQPFPDPTTQATARSMVSDATDSPLLDLDRSGSYLPFNRFVAIGDPPGQVPVRGQADITDPGNPLHRDRIGLRVAPYIRSAALATQDQANAVAKAALIRQAFLQDAIDAPVLPDPTVDEGDIAAIYEPISGTNDRYWLRSVTHPVTQGATNVSAPRVVDLFAVAA